MKFITPILAGALLSSSMADVKLAAIFSDHAVLQQQETIPVWGWADPEEEVSVSLGDQTQKTKAAADGKWMVKLPKMSSGGPFTLTATGKNTVTSHDILVGEVWLGSGQSNMAMAIDRVTDAKKEIATANWPRIRMFKEQFGQSKTPRTDAKGSWEICSPASVPHFSATLYFFGRAIHESENVPVGLINSSVGGSAIETWISPEAYAKIPASQTLAEKVKTPIKRNGPSAKSVLFNGKIAPLIPYAIRGIVWYQGEANSLPGEGGNYQQLLTALVEDWRTKWGKELPFAWVQLPKFKRPGQGWSLVREGMLKSLSLPKTGMAITVDLGDEMDIHPKDKQQVGQRLALWALGTVYGKTVPATSGPIPEKHEIRDAEIVVSFLHANDGLKPKDGAELRGFVIAGDDQKWHPAMARIEGTRIIASSDVVKKPVALRYAWATVPDCNLINGANLPASPFRTDVWPIVDIEPKTKKE
jgi:sialate O-acetylesterase